jgi:hypothetical protein
MSDETLNKAKSFGIIRMNLIKNDFKLYLLWFIIAKIN